MVKSQMTEIFDYDIMADDMISLFTHLKLTKFSILGFSDGAIVATKMALKAPQLIHKLFFTWFEYKCRWFDPSIFR